MFSRRSILIVFVALSIALVPARGAFALSLNAMETTVSAAMPDCCDGQDMPCENSVSQCPLMALCAATTVGLLGTSFSALTYPLLATDQLPVFVSVSLDSQLACPPFRPPRV